MALETRERVERFIRALAKRSAKKIADGTNEELISAREKMPEPTRYKFESYRVPLYRVPLYEPYPLGFFATEFPVSIKTRTATFTRVLVKNSTGTTFWAWQNTEDGCVYV